jgi:hypothetical protein
LIGQPIYVRLRSSEVLVARLISLNHAYGTILPIAISNYWTSDIHALDVCLIRPVNLAQASTANGGTARFGYELIHAFVPTC